MLAKELTETKNEINTNEKEMDNRFQQFKSELGRLQYLIPNPVV
jgi:hypothetical protein